MVRVGLFDHWGWAVAVTATADGEVVDRRRIELVEPGVAAEPSRQARRPDKHGAVPPRRSRGERSTQPG